VLEYLGAAAAGVLGAYALALAIVRPAGQAALLRWFMGSLSNAEGAPAWHGEAGYGAAALWAWLKMTVNIFVSNGPELASPPPWPAAPVFLWGARALLAFFAVRLARDAPRLSGPARGAAAACGVWLLAYALVFTSWEPYTMVYRVSDLVPMVLLLWLGGRAGRVAGRVETAAALALAACLGLGNLGADVWPRSFASNNPHLARMDFIRETTSPEDWVITLGGGAEELYLPFFAERRPIQLGAYARRRQDLTVLLDALIANGRSVYATSRVLEDEPWRAYLGRYALTPSEPGPGGFTLYRLAAKRGLSGRRRS
jgi:hypothetical protein